MSLVEWFATPCFKDFLSWLGPDHPSNPGNRSADGDQEMKETGSGGGTELHTHISPSTSVESNSSTEHSTISNTSTAPTEECVDPPSLSYRHIIAVQITSDDDGEDEDDNEEDEEGDEAGLESGHWAGCPCDLEAADNPDDPCIAPLLGVMQLWAARRWQTGQEVHVNGVQH
ncbi:hypothetical protein B0H19DRAFT_1380414 [Mycena capillaripes]|nr:hypothetical protein B0H19DRAFT_1380414 [Mycena capillaripes]